MFKSLSILGSALAFLTVAHATGIECKREPRGEVPLVNRLSYQVAGSGRLYLLSGPSDKCRDKTLFVVPGDALTAYSEYGTDGEWSYVMYTSKSGKDASGWVSTKRLRFVGAAGIDMSPDTISFFREAAAAARRGRLGSPFHSK